METWKAAIGHEGRYEVSNLGNVRSLDRSFAKSDGRQQKVTGRMLKPCADGAGYLHVRLSVSVGHAKNVMVHRLVAEAFVATKVEAGCVDHINGKKHDNRADNLRWVTSSQNANFRHVSRGATGVVGVFYSPKSNTTNPYKVEIKVTGKSKFIGYYPTIELASAAREEALAKHVSGADIKEAA